MHSEYGALGLGIAEAADGGTVAIESSVPSRVRHALEEERVVAASTGGTFSAVLTEKGQVWTFGCGDDGQLGLGVDGMASDGDGDGDADDDDYVVHAVPQLVKALCDVRIEFICLGQMHALALSNKGLLWSWGNNEYGQLGTGDRSNRNEPTSVEVSISPPDPAGATAPRPRERVVQVAASYATSAAVTDGRHVWCWGWGQHAQMGLGADSSDQPLPSRVPGVDRALSVACHEFFTCAVLQGPGGRGELWAWGNLRERDMLSVPLGFDSDDPWQGSAVPRRVRSGGLGDKSVAIVGCGGGHVVVVTDEGCALSWGCGLIPSIDLLTPIHGHGRRDAVLTPTPIPNLPAPVGRYRRLPAGQSCFFFFDSFAGDYGVRARPPALLISQMLPTPRTATPPPHLTPTPPTTKF